MFLHYKCFHSTAEWSYICSYILLSTLMVQGACPWWKLWSIKYVTVEQGTLCGLRMKSFSGRDFYAFRAIPFAQPPVGNLRFKPPVPATKWEGTLDATADGPTCIQTTTFMLKTIGVEDCLYLNVYSPKVPDDNTKNASLDVMVWIFPGEFYNGDGSSSTYPPYFFMNKDVVLVTFNYRLGSFGFLSTFDDAAPGNYGMKDQVLVFKWVQKNIASFGGNPNSVTIFGYSSGASSVHFHLLSPATEGLFHRAISMDGTTINPFAVTPGGVEHAKKQARLVHCPTEPTSELVECLRDMDAVKLSDSITELFDWWTTAAPGYTPVVENKTDKNPEPFLTEHPLDILREGKMKKLPYILGGTHDPGLVFTATVLNWKLLRDQLNQDNYDILSKVLLLDLDVPKEKVPWILEQVLNFYLGDERQFNGETLENYTKLVSDDFFLFPIHKTAQLHARANHRNLYLYNLAYRGLFSTTMTSSLKNYGTSHGDPVVFLFPYLNYSPGSHDAEMREMLLTMWTSFAKYGNPTPPEKTGNVIVDELTWEPIGDVNIQDMHLPYLNIGQVVPWSDAGEYLNLGLGPVKLEMASDLNKERMDFWDSLPLRQNCLSDCD